MIHGDRIISGVKEERQDKRPQCAWPVKKEITGSNGDHVPVMRPCGSEDRVFNVKGSGKYTGRPLETPVCSRHLPEAIKQWNWDSAEPL